MIGKVRKQFVSGVTLCMLSLLVLCTTGCFGDLSGNMLSENESSGNYSSMDEMPVYSVDYLNAYVEANNIDIPKARKKNVIEKALKNNSEAVSVKQETTLFSSVDRYVVTREATELMYIGETKDNKPDGVGRIIKLISAREYTEDGTVRAEFEDYTYGGEEFEVIGVLVYVGEFKDGRYDGYGWEHLTPDSEWASSLYRCRDIGEDYVSVGSSLQENVMATCNPICYMGEFKKGQYHGDGINISYAARELPAGMSEKDIIDKFGYRVDRELGFYVGEFKKGERTGQAKEYLRGRLYYSGNERNAEYHGEGTLYYVGTNQIKYKGHWANGEYDGKGTLYDEDGSVIYDGKWNMGDYAH